ncbi:MAG: DUF1501 domain-containing protein, partial [Rhizobacter sp.]|nr:DUF1501 domain-containing protein [Rhizobacter sp.]
MDRRQFLRAAATVSAGATLNQLASFTAEAAGACDDYKALVCLFLFGGNDANNMIVPADGRYAQYAAARGRQGAGGLTLDPLSLAWLNSPGPAYYALHPQLAPLTALWDAGQMAVMFNVGPLLHPMTKADFIANRYPLPYNLMSHADQQIQWMNAVSTGPASSGWGGRLAEQACGSGGTLPPVLS